MNVCRMRQVPVLPVPPGVPGFALVVASFALACGGDAGTTAPLPRDTPSATTTLELPVRIHLLSSRLITIDASLTDQEVESLLQRVNEVWSEANIVWELESIIREQAEAEDQLELALQGAVPLTHDLIAAVVPRGHLFAGKWDVFIVHDLAVAGAPGLYFSSIPAVVSSEVDPAGLGDPGRILAHELGHSLTLPHVPCTPAGNLMSPGCNSEDRTRLAPLQIQQARTQAERGRPPNS